MKHPDKYKCYVCNTGQHKEMLQQVIDYFDIPVHYDLAIMHSNQTLFSITINSLKKMEDVLEEAKPDVVLVQGDTTTAFVATLAAYYKKIKVAHIEAGLRTNNKYAPFPEEVNRSLIGCIADIHFAPTVQAADNLKKENISEHVYITGNTVIDALLHTKEKEKNSSIQENKFSFLDKTKKNILVTGHRRENLGKPFEDICHAIKTLADMHEDIEFTYPVHLNPQVMEPVKRILGNHPRIHLIDPLDYPSLVWLMNRSYIILTDSGGIQEEAPALGKPVLVMRETTERPEGVEAGSAKLVGTNQHLIINSINELLNNTTLYNQMANTVNPYGTGNSAVQIIEKLNTIF